MTELGKNKLKEMFYMDIRKNLLTISAKIVLAENKAELLDLSSEINQLVQNINDKIPDDNSVKKARLLHSFGD